MPRVTLLECDACRRPGEEETVDGSPTGRILCAECALEISMQRAGVPYFRNMETEWWQWEGPVWSGSYTTWGEREVFATRLSAEQVDFLDMMLTPDEAHQLIDDVDKVNLYLGRHEGLRIGRFTVSVDVSVDTEVRFGILTEAVQSWLRPALGIGCHAGCTWEKEAGLLSAEDGTPCTHL